MSNDKEYTFLKFEWMNYKDEVSVVNKIESESGWHVYASTLKLSAICQ